MLIILLLLVAGIIIPIWVYKGTGPDYSGSFNNRKYNTIITTGGIIILYIFTALINYTTSYENAIDLEIAYESSFGLSQSAVAIYQSGAKHDHSTGYADLIYQLRKVAADHNKDLMKKRAYKNNPWFSWLIIMPKHNKLLKL